MNKAKKVREALNFTPTQAGQLLFGYSPKQAYDTWRQWENGNKKPSAPTRSFFRAILILAEAKDLGTQGCDKALELIIKEFSK